MAEKKVEFGKRYRDKVHGVEGVAVARSEHMNACSRVCLEWMAGGEIKERWFDESDLVGVAAGDKPGGTRPAPPSREPVR